MEQWRGQAHHRRAAPVLLEQVGFDIYTPAMPKIAEHFAATNTLVQNTATVVYVLGMALVVVPVGTIADAVGRKRVLLSGLALMLLTSIGLALADSMLLMLVLRFVQGFGAGTCLLLAATMAADCFRGAKLVSVLGMLGAAWGAAPVLAPAVGGFIVSSHSWRLVFVVLAATVAAVTVLVAVALPETLQPQHRAPVDVRAAAGVLGQALRHPAFVGFTAMFGLVGSGPDGIRCRRALPLSGRSRVFPCRLRFHRPRRRCGQLRRRGDLRRVGAADHDTVARNGRCRSARIGRRVMIASAQLVGVSAVFITAGAGLAMLSTGVLDPLSKGLAMGVFSRNIGLITGLIGTVCYASITVSMALVAWLPEKSRARWAGSTSPWRRPSRR